MRGYVPTANRRLRTGDIDLDDDGFLWIDGRVSDAINRGGLKIYPGDVEEVLPGPDRRRRVRGRRGRPPGRRGAVGVDRARPGMMLDADARAAVAPYALAAGPVPGNRRAPRNEVEEGAAPC
jgi:acyl-CoA synthetase (AMP-forming)/AMP-acid ligase II